MKRVSRQAWWARVLMKGSVKVVLNSRCFFFTYLSLRTVEATGSCYSQSNSVRREWGVWPSHAVYVYGCTQPSFGVRLHKCPYSSWFEEGALVRRRRVQRQGTAKEEIRDKPLFLFKKKSL